MRDEKGRMDIPQELVQPCIRFFNRETDVYAGPLPDGVLSVTGTVQGNGRMIEVVYADRSKLTLTITHSQEPPE